MHTHSLTPQLSPRHRSRQRHECRRISITKDASEGMLGDSKRLPERRTSLFHFRSSCAGLQSARGTADRTAGPWHRASVPRRDTKGARRHYEGSTPTGAVRTADAAVCTAGGAVQNSGQKSALRPAQRGLRSPHCTLRPRKSEIEDTPPRLQAPQSRLRRSQCAVQASKSRMEDTVDGGHRPPGAAAVGERWRPAGESFPRARQRSPGARELFPRARKTFRELGKRSRRRFYT